MDPYIKAHLDDFVTQWVHNAFGRLDLLETAVQQWAENPPGEATASSMKAFIEGFIAGERGEIEKLRTDFKAELGVHARDLEN